MKPLEELNAEKLEQAAKVFVREQIKAWEIKARDDAVHGDYKPPTVADLALADCVYNVAWSRRRYKISKAKRTEPQKTP